MAVTHLLDTTVLSQPVKDVPDEHVLSRWSAVGDRAVCTSAICLAELKQGLEYRQSEKYWRRFRELLENHYPVLPFDEAVASTYAHLAAELKRIGKPKPTIDLFIAATAKHHGLVVATLNIRHFNGIPGVAVESWGD